VGGNGANGNAVEADDAQGQRRLEVSAEAFGDGYCALGYTGPLCAVCSHAGGFFFDSTMQKCVSCEAATVYAWTSFTVVLFLGLIGFGVFGSFAAWLALKVDANPVESGVTVTPWQSFDDRIKQWVALSKAAEARGEAMYEKIKIKIKMLCIFAQIAVQIGFNCDVTYPAVLAQTFSQLSVVNLQVSRESVAVPANAAL
jgi:hypothetical protein